MVIPMSKTNDPGNSIPTPYVPSLRDELHKTIDLLPFETLAQVKAFVDIILPTVRSFTLQDAKARRKEILKLGRKYNISNIAVFGSVARGESSGKSDVDFIVDLDFGAKAFDFINFMLELKKLLGYKVDVAPRKDLKKYIREEALREAVML